MPIFTLKKKIHSLIKVKALFCWNAEECNKEQSVMKEQLNVSNAILS